jgi:hypothetical protein
MIFLRLIWALFCLFGVLHMVWSLIQARRAKKLLKEALLHMPPAANVAARARIEKAINIL